MSTSNIRNVAITPHYMLRVSTGQVAHVDPEVSALAELRGEIQMPLSRTYASSKH